MEVVLNHSKMGGGGFNPNARVIDGGLVCKYIDLEMTEQEDLASAILVSITIIINIAPLKIVAEMEKEEEDEEW